MATLSDKINHLKQYEYLIIKMIRLASFIKTNYIIFIFLIAISFALILFWMVMAKIQSFKNYQISIAQHAVDNVALNIPLFIQERQRLVKLFVQQNQDLINRLVENPEAMDSLDKLSEKLQHFFPQSHTFTIADPQGVPLFDDFDGKILETCLNDIQLFSRVNQYQPYVHPHPELYHFDIMHHITINFQPYIFFISFKADILAPFLKAVQTQGHQVMLVYPDKNMLLEVSAEGARNHWIRDDYRLSPQEQARFLAKQKVQATRWNVVDSYLPELFSDFKQQQINHAIIIYMVFFLFLLVMTWRIYQGQQKLLNREACLKDLNNHLEDEIKQGVKQIQQEYELRQKHEKYILQEEQVASLGRMVSGVAHEINGPVGSALMGVSFIKFSIQEIQQANQNKKLSQVALNNFLNESDEMCSTIELSLNNAASLIKSFKVVSVEQSNEQLRNFHLNDYIKDILRSMVNQLKQSQIQLEIHCDTAIQLTSYPGYYSQILNNLINNSLMHGFKSGQSGHIDIEFSKQQDRLKIIYRDTGKGIAKNHQKKIFDPFFSTNRDGGGTGQGLFIIARIIQSKLNGSIQCHSEVNQGVCFEIDVQADFEPEAEQITAI